MQIDHDPEEPPRDTSKSPWGILAVLVMLGWAGALYSFDIDWRSVALGAFSAGALVAWAGDITGGKVPASWRGKPTSPRRVQGIDDGERRGPPVRRTR